VLLQTLFMALTSFGPPQDWFVDASAPGCATATGGPGDPFCTLADAIGAAAGGDTIHVAPGTYVENLRLDKDLNLRGTEGEALTIVDGNQGGTVVTVCAGVTATIDGFTIRNGLSELGAGILVDSSDLSPLTSLTLSSSTVSDNTAFSLFTARGGGIAARANSDVLLFRSTIRDNAANGTPDLVFLSSAFGGGISNEGSLSVLECTLDGNRVDAEFDYSGAAIASSGPLTIASTRITNHVDGVGRAITSSGPLSLTNSTLARNRLLTGLTGASVLSLSGTSPALVDGCILWDNGVIFTVGYDPIDDPGNNATVTYSLLQGGWNGAGANNIDTDPLFVDAANGDYRVQPLSPCVDAGGPGLFTTSRGRGGNPRRLDGDLDRTMVVDMGAYELGNVHLDVSGSATPGGQVTLHLAGTAGLTARLVVASAPGELVFSPAGTLFFDLGSPYFKFGAGTLPNTLNLTIPPTVPPGTPTILQAFAIGPPLPNGKLPLNFSNAVELVIR